MYRDDDASGALRQELIMCLAAIPVDLDENLADDLRARVADARAAIRAVGGVAWAAHIEAVQAASAQLSALPMEIPAVPGLTPTALADSRLANALPKRVEDLRVGEDVATFRCDGQPFVHKVGSRYGARGGFIGRPETVWAEIALFTSVPRRLRSSEVPHEALTWLPMVGANALAPPSLDVRRGVASVTWQGELADLKAHEGAIAALVTIRAASRTR